MHARREGSAAEERRWSTTAVMLSSGSEERDPVSRILCSHCCVQKRTTKITRINIQLRQRLSHHTVANVLRAVSSSCSVLKSACKSPTGSLVKSSGGKINEPENEIRTRTPSITFLITWKYNAATSITWMLVFHRRVIEPRADYTISVLVAVAAQPRRLVDYGTQAPVS